MNDIPESVRRLLAEMRDLLEYFHTPRKTMCFCSDGPLCQICRTKRAIEAARPAQNQAEKTEPPFASQPTKSKGNV